tara:strand:- start:2207 stop:2377 length:171 start_codon:yes stop_codon:yes gene_type:complete
MKTLKITLALVAVLLLTVSGVKSESNLVSENNEIHQPTKIELLAHNKSKIKKPTNG